MKKFDEVDMLNPEPVFLDLIIDWFTRVLLRR